MSLAVGTGFGLRTTDPALSLAQLNVGGVLQLVVDCDQWEMGGGVPGSPQASARRSPEARSYAMATTSPPSAIVVFVIAQKFPNALPSQIHAFASLFVESPPIKPMESLPALAARRIWLYWISLFKGSVSFRYCSPPQPELV